MAISTMILKNANIAVHGSRKNLLKFIKLNDYIKFKKADIEDNKKEYDEITKKNKENSNMKSNRAASSYYYLNLLNSIK